MTEKTEIKKGPFMEWVDKRYPWTDFWKKHLREVENIGFKFLQTTELSYTNSDKEEYFYTNA